LIFLTIVCGKLARNKVLKPFNTSLIELTKRSLAWVYSNDLLAKILENKLGTTPIIIVKIITVTTRQTLKYAKVIIPKTISLICLMIIMKSSTPKLLMVVMSLVSQEL